MTRRRFLASISAIAIPLIALDLGSKALAESALAGKGPISFLGDFVILVFVRNRGAFLSLGGDFAPWARMLFLIILPAAAILAFALWLVLRAKPSPRLAWVSALFLAGGLGNLPERLFAGSVRDFLNFGLGKLRTGVLNVADLYLTAAIILCFVLFRQDSDDSAQSDSPIS